jgi:predicted PurR-regulated permease PerM
MPVSLSPPDRRLLWIAAGLLACWFIWFQWRLLLLAFAGLLLAIVLHSISAWMERHTPLRAGLAYLATLTCIGGIVALSALFLGPRLITQLAAVGAALPQSIADITGYLQRTSWGPTLLGVLNRALKGIDNGAKLTLFAKDILATVVDFIVVLVIGFFAALNPRAYRDGLLSMLPEQHYGRARALTDEIVETLKYWVLGQMVPMAVLGLASMIALWMLGVHLAFTLGLLTGVMVFIPYLGTVLSSVPAILLALQHSPRTALYVIALYAIFHTLEGYLLTPLVQRKAVRLPPVLTVLSEFCLWSFAGILGVAVAAPLTAAGLVLIRHFYPTRHRHPASHEAKATARDS